MAKLELSDNTLNVIQMGLVELPYRLAAPVFEDINRQLEADRKKAQLAIEEEKNRNR